VPNAATVLPVPNPDPADNPGFLPFQQVVFRGIGGLHALLNGSHLVLSVQINLHRSGADKFTGIATQMKLSA
jgi:hypothetical protein